MVRICLVVLINIWAEETEIPKYLSPLSVGAGLRLDKIYD